MIIPGFFMSLFNASNYITKYPTLQFFPNPSG